MAYERPKKDFNTYFVLMLDRSTTYHEENRRTLTRSYGLKFVIDVEGEGRKFDPVKLILAIGASVGLFSLASDK